MFKDLRLTIELVPSPCWHNNMRSEMSRAAWDKLRKQVYAQYNYHCGICQNTNVQLHCHEIWHYDDVQHVQKLVGFITLCEMCHHCKHIGHAGILAREGNLDFEKVIEHFMHVNQCSREDYEEHSEEVWAKWDERNKFQWTTDLGIYTNLVSPKPIVSQTKSLWEENNS